MQRRKLNALLCGLALGASIFLPGQVSAEVRTVEADGVYQMGDGMAENQAIAKERAKAEAVRSAGEQAAAYVESDTVVSNGKVTKDDIRLMTAAVLELKDVTFTPVVIGESIQFRCHVVAVVDTDKVHEKIQEDNINLKVSLKQSEEENERLRQEMEGLKQQYKTASASQRKNMDKKVEENDIAYEINSLLKQGAISQSKKDYSTAIKYYEKALNLNPNYFQSYLRLVFYYSELGKQQQVIEYGEKCLASNVENEKDYFFLGYVNLNMGRAYLSFGEYQEARECFKKIIDMVPFSGWDLSMKNLLNKTKGISYAAIGITYFMEGEYQKAITNAEESVKICPNDAEFVGILGSIYEGVGDMEKAQKYYEKEKQLKNDKSKK